MTSNTAPAPYVVNASSINSATYDKWKAFNGGTIGAEDAWLTVSGTTTGWLSIDLATPSVVNCYRLTSRNGANGNLAAPRDWTFEGSDNGVDWTILDTQSGIVFTALNQMQEFTFPNSTPYRYYRINITANGGYATWTGIGEFSLWEITSGESKYYVSQQNGNDNNNGLSPDTAWATINKAVNTVGADPAGDTYIYIAPGVYRETLSLVEYNAGATNRVIFAGDPDCLQFPNDNPGIVRLTGCGVDEMPSDAIIIAFNAVDFVEFSDFWFDGGSQYSLHPIVGTAGLTGQVFRRCRCQGRLGFDNCTCYDCFAIGYVCFIRSICYNCIGMGGGALTTVGVFHTCTCVNCLAIGGAYGYYNCPSYNCISIGSQYGFYGSTSKNCYVAYTQSGSHNTGTHTNITRCQAGNTTNSAPVLLLNFDIQTILKNALFNTGTLDIDSYVFPSTDINGLPRLGGDGTVDIGPWENPDYSLDWENYYHSAPSIKLKGESQLTFKFPVEAGRDVIKLVRVKHVNTASDKKPRIICRGLGMEFSTSAASEPDTWELLSLTFTPSRTGIMEFVLSTRDTDADSYSLFSDII
jgi:hypothetical protein